MASSMNNFSPQPALLARTLPSSSSPMKLPLRILARCFILPLALLTGCNKLGSDRFGRTGEPGRIPEALTHKEVGFLVRMNSSEAEILATVAHRGLAKTIDSEAAAQLASLGAKPQLIETLKNSPYVLTRAEQALYDERMEKRNAGVPDREQAEQDFVNSQRAGMNNRIQSAERTRLEDQAAQLQSKINGIKREQEKVPYSNNSNSPYQQRAKEISQVKQELDQVNASMRKM
jgi:hypothetical protein